MKLGVNIDHVATLRQAREGVEPDPLEAAKICERAGAHSVVMHLREDRRHIQDKDLFRVKDALSIKLNLEMSVHPSIVRVASSLMPDQVTLVPEKRRERTTEGGLDLFKKKGEIARCAELFRAKGVLLSLFIDPDLRSVREAKRLGADAVELHTGDYAAETGPLGVKRQLKRLADAATVARRMGLVIHAGHGLDYKNVALLKRVPGIEELNIGYAIVTRALWVGLENAIKEMRELIAC